MSKMIRMRKMRREIKKIWMRRNKKIEYKKRTIIFPYQIQNSSRIKLE